MDFIKRVKAFIKRLIRFITLVWGDFYCWLLKYEFTRELVNFFTALKNLLVSLFKILKKIVSVTIFVLVFLYESYAELAIAIRDVIWKHRKKIIDWIVGISTLIYLFVSTWYFIDAIITTFFR